MKWKLSSVVVSSFFVNKENNQAEGTIKNMKFILGKKREMTQIFLDNGDVIPVTKVMAGPCQIVQVKKNNGVNAVQIGFEEKREKNLSKPLLGHLKGLKKSAFLKSFQIDESVNSQMERGDIITVATFVEGDKVAVTGYSKGRGFAGVVKRHGFAGGPASHGHKDNLRAPGSIGSTGPQRVFKGTRMAGRMGGDQVTVANLEIVKIEPENNVIYIKGAVPGAREGLLIVKGEGELKVEKKSKEEPKEVEEIKEEKAQEVNIEKAGETVEEKKEEAK